MIHFFFFLFVYLFVFCLQDKNIIVKEPDFFEILQKRIESKVVDFTAYASEECWKWGAAIKQGSGNYGKVQFAIDHIPYNTTAHRAMYVAVHKTLPQDLPLDISHLCHEGLCVNPKHLVHEDRIVNLARRNCKESSRPCSGHWLNGQYHQPCIQPDT